MAGFSMGEADTLRKVMGKKNRERSRAEREKFVAGAVAQGTRAAGAEDLFDLHRAVRRLRVQRLTRVRLRLRRLPDRLPDGAPSRRVHGRDPHVGQGRQGSQALLPVRVPRDGHRGPAARRQRVRNRLRPGARRRRAIRYGLSAVRNVGGGAVAGDHRGPRGRRAVRVVRRLLPTGSSRRRSRSACWSPSSSPARSTRWATPAAACCTGRRAASFEKVSAPILAERKAEAAGQFSLFGGEEGVVEIDESVLDGEEFDKRLLLSKEKEMLGQFVTDHPLLGVEDRWRRSARTRSPTSRTAMTASSS